MENEIRSISTPMGKVNIGTTNLGELFREVLDCPVVDTTPVSILSRYFIKRNGEIEPLAFKGGEINAKVHRALTALYDYLCTCPDRNVMQLESLTSAMLKAGIIDEWSLRPFHQEKMGKMLKQVRSLRKHKYGHQGKYAHMTYQTKKKDRCRFTEYEEKSSREKKADIAQDSINLTRLINTIDSFSSRTLESFTVGEKLVLIKQIQNAIKVAASKGHTTEACELYRIFNSPKFDEFKSLVGSDKYNKQLAEMIVDSYAKHTRLAVTPYEELMTHAIIKAQGKDLSSNGVMAKYSKTLEARKFIDGLYEGKYGKLLQGNEAFRKYLIERYNHYLDSSKGVEELTPYITNTLKREEKNNSLIEGSRLLCIVDGAKKVDGEIYPVIIGRDEEVDNAIIKYLDSQKISESPEL